jgi:hypothetical protein
MAATCCLAEASPGGKLHPDFLMRILNTESNIDANVRRYSHYADFPCSAASRDLMDFANFKEEMGQDDDSTLVAARVVGSSAFLIPRFAVRLGG